MTATGLLWTGALLHFGVGAAEIDGVRIWPAPGNTRIVFDLSAPDGFNVTPIAGPDRLVVDFATAHVAQPLRLAIDDPDIVAGLRHASRESGTRIVIDLRKAVEVSYRLLEPHVPYGHRLVLDLKGDRSERSAPPPAPEVTASVPRHAASLAPKASDRAADVNDRGNGRDVIVAVDAGHGGDDAGAIGPGGTREKNITFAMARDLAKLINAQRGMKAVLTRGGDYYIGLSKRTEIARANGADLFISIHADAFRDRRVAGGSVYVVSAKGATSTAAQWLADAENASDLAGGVTLNDKDETLQAVLLRMSQSAVLDGSIDVAQSILASMRRVGTVHKNYVERAGFVVLKSPDIPSVLVEVAFISNPKEEKNLNDPAYRQKLAQAMFAGVSSYFARHAAPGTLLADLRRAGQGTDPILAMARGTGQLSAGRSGKSLQ